MALLNQHKAKKSVDSQGQTPFFIEKLKFILSEFGFHFALNDTGRSILRIKNEVELVTSADFIGRNTILILNARNAQILCAVQIMHFEAVLVSFGMQGDDKTYSTSGILFNTNRVLISGTSLVLLAEQEKWIYSFIKSTSAEPKTNEHIKNLSFRVFVECKESEIEKFPKKIIQLESAPIGVWNCPLVSESIINLFNDWSIGCMIPENESEALASAHMSKELISIFILLKCEGEKVLKLTEKDDDIRALLNLRLSLKKPKRGQEVGILSSPFGNKHFMNSLSRGVISNIVGSKKCIILTDARTVSGCEGGPIFFTKKSWEQKEELVLLGVVTCPLTWWKGEWIGLTLGISLFPVLKRLFRKEDETCWQVVVGNVTTYSSDLSTVDFIDEIVVFIRSKTSWGAGVILNADSGIIITCAHVVKDSNTVSVFQKGIRYSANVVFKSQDDIAYDLAILKISENVVFMNEANFSINPAKLGKTVIAVGFPFFSEKDEPTIRPSIATGCVARVNPYMIQTTCCIQSGFSGGGLFQDKKLLGIIISNVKDSTAGALFPHINFIVPSSVFKEPVLNYIKTNNATFLKELECSDIKVQALWKLQNSKL